MTWQPDGRGGWYQDDPSDDSPRPLGASEAAAPLRSLTREGSSSRQTPRGILSAPRQSYGTQGLSAPPPEAFEKPPSLAPAPPTRDLALQGAPARAQPQSPSPAPSGEVRTGTTRQAQTAPSPLTPEEEAILAAGSTANLGGGMIAYDNPQLLERQRARGYYDPADWDLPAQLVAKKAGLPEGSVRWDQDSQTFVIPGGNNGQNITIADVRGNVNAQGLELAEAQGIKPTPSIAEGQAPGLEQGQEEAAGGIEQNNAEAQAAVDSLLNDWRNANSVDTSAADESRRLQRDVFNRQTAIINRILDFDPEVYAQMFADQSLSALNAQARSARGGAGAVNAALFGAQAQAPALFAEGSRQAAQLENQRLGMAGDVAAQSGQLATDVRAGDEQRSQFVADLGVRVTQGLTDLTGMDLQLDARAQEQVANMALEFAQLYQGYVGMDLQSQLAQWDNLMRKYATDAQTSVAMEQIRAQLEAGKIGWDDVGLALLSVGGQVGAGFATRK